MSAAGFGGKPLAVVELALKKEFLVIISSHILTEVRKNLIEKVGIKGPVVDRFLENISEVAAFFTPTGSVKILHDPEDDKVLETALMGFADVLVTGDKAIVDLKSVGDLKIETTSTFLSRFSKK